MKDIANATKRLVSKKNQGKLCEKGECTIRKNNNLRILTSGTGIGKEHVKGR